jgi:dienelactone hydrolase
MKNIILSTIFALAATTMAHAAVKGQMIEYKQDGVTMEGYLAYDDTITGKRPGILVVHEWKGLNDFAKKRADMLAQLGYVAFAADIYGKGVRPSTNEAAGAEAGKYKNNRPLLRQRVLAALDVLKNQPNVDSNKLGAIGFCFGGTTVLELARSGADVKGIVSFHGGLSSPTPQDAKNIKAKILVLHGGADPFESPEEVAGFKKEMEDAKVDYQFVVYPGAMHGFTNPANDGSLKGALYNAEADQKSWAAMKNFFSQILYD